MAARVERNYLLVSVDPVAPVRTTPPEIICGIALGVIGGGAVIGAIAGFTLSSFTQQNGPLSKLRVRQIPGLF